MMDTLTTKQTAGKLIILQLLRITIICITVIMVMDRVYANICYWGFEIPLTDFADYHILFRVAPFLLLTALLELLFKKIEKNSNANRTVRTIEFLFLLIKSMLLICALVYWLFSVNRHYSEYLSLTVEWQKNFMRFEEPSAVAVSEKFGMVIVFVYLSEFLFHCGFRINQALAQQKIILKSPGKAISTLLYECPEFNITKKEKILRVLEISFFCFAFLNSICKNIAPYQISRMWTFVSNAYWNHSANIFEWFLDTIVYAPYNNLWFFAIIQLYKYGFCKSE